MKYAVKLDPKVFVPYRGISNLNERVKNNFFMTGMFSSPTGAYLISIELATLIRCTAEFSSPTGAYLISIA